MRTVTVTMPAPPSVNNLFANAGRDGRVPSKKYKNWRRDAGWAVKAQMPGSLTGPVTILVEHGARRGRVDPDNLFKAPLDLLVSLGVIEDDNARIVTELTGRPNVAGVEGCRVTISQVEAA